mgnify:FL=1
MSVRLNFAWMLASRAIAVASGLLVAGMINRALGPAGRGVYAEMQTWIGLFVVLFGMSFDSGIYHHANKSIYGEDDNSRFVTILWLSVGQSMIGAIGLTLFVYIAPGHVSSQTVQFIPYLAVLLFSSMITANLTVFTQSLGRIKFAALVGVIQACLGLLIVSYGYLTEDLDLFYAVCCLIAVQTSGLAVFLTILLRVGMGRGRFSWTAARGIIKAGAKQHIATIATFVYARINQLIVFRYGGDAEAGIFAVALSLAFYLTFIPETLRTVLYPRVIHSSDEYDVTVRSIRLSLYGWGAAVMILMLFAKPIIIAYAGEKFVGSVNTFRILLIAAWLLPLSSLLAPFYVKKGAFSMASLSALILGIISVLLNCAFVPRLLSEGAALATALTCAIGFMMTCLFLWYLSKANPLSIFVPNFKREARKFAGFFG